MAKGARFMAASPVASGGRRGATSRPLSRRGPGLPVLPSALLLPWASRQTPRSFLSSCWAQACLPLPRGPHLPRIAPDAGGGRAADLPVNIVEVPRGLVSQELLAPYPHPSPLWPPLSRASCRGEGRGRPLVVSHFVLMLPSRGLFAVCICS